MRAVRKGEAEEAIHFDHAGPSERLPLTEQDDPALQMGGVLRGLAATACACERLSKASPMSIEQLESMELDAEITGQSQLDLKGTEGKVWGTETDLDENAYGAAAVALVRDVPIMIREYKEGYPWRMRSLTMARLAFSTGIMAVNLLFQGIILWYIYIFVAQPSVRGVQALYHDFRMNNFDEQGRLLDTAWESYERKEEVCQITMSSLSFYYAVLLLWALLMMMELRSVQRVTMDIWEVRTVKSTEEMLHMANDDDLDLGGKCLVVGITRPIRAVVIGFVCIPRFIIALILLYVGCHWLSSSASFSDMTLNAMALEFVHNIDELLYEAILPRQLKRQIAETNVFRIQPRFLKRDVDGMEWQSFRGTICWIALMMGSLALFGQALQTVLPMDLTELTYLCKSQVEESTTPLCTFPTFNGWSEACYPYGLRTLGSLGVGGDAHGRARPHAAHAHAK